MRISRSSVLVALAVMAIVVGAVNQVSAAGWHLIVVGGKGGQEAIPVYEIDMNTYDVMLLGVMAAQGGGTSDPGLYGAPVCRGSRLFVPGGDWDDSVNEIAEFNLLTNKQLPSRIVSNTDNWERYSGAATDMTKKGFKAYAVQPADGDTPPSMVMFRAKGDMTDLGEIMRNGDTLHDGIDGGALAFDANGKLWLFDGRGASGMYRVNKNRMEIKGPKKFVIYTDGSYMRIAGAFFHPATNQLFGLANNGGEGGGGSDLVRINTGSGLATKVATLPGDAHGMTLCKY